MSRLRHNCFHYCRLLKKHLFCYKWQSAVFYKRLFLLFKWCDTDSVFLPHTWIATGLVCFAIDWFFWQYKEQSCSGHLYSPLPYACVGTKRNTKFHGVARVQLGRLPIVGLTGWITLYREWGNLYRGNECLNPTSNNSTVQEVSRGYISGRAKWQFA